MALVAIILRNKTFSDRNKLRPFECGFSHSNSSRISFSFRFFLIALIFLIFDVELVLLFPFFSTINFTISSLSFISLTLFLGILGLGLYYEWASGMLEWSKFDWIFKKSFTVNEKMALALSNLRKTNFFILLSKQNY